jgi:hypothetical protein
MRIQRLLWVVLVLSGCEVDLGLGVEGPMRVNGFVPPDYSGSPTPQLALTLSEKTGTVTAVVTRAGQSFLAGYLDEPSGRCMTVWHLDDSKVSQYQDCDQVGAGLAVNVLPAGGGVLVSGYTVDGQGDERATLWEVRPGVDPPIQRSVLDLENTWGHDVAWTVSGSVFVAGEVDLAGSREAHLWSADLDDSLVELTGIQERTGSPRWRSMLALPGTQEILVAGDEATYGKVWRYQADGAIATSLAAPLVLETAASRLYDLTLGCGSDGAGVMVTGQLDNFSDAESVAFAWCIVPGAPYDVLGNYGGVLFEELDQSLVVADIHQGLGAGILRHVFTGETRVVSFQAQSPLNTIPEIESLELPPVGSLAPRPQVLALRSGPDETVEAVVTGEARDINNNGYPAVWHLSLR